MSNHEKAAKGHDLGGRSDNLRTTLLGFAAAGTVVMFWSGFNIVSRLGGRSALTPFDVAALRFGISALLLAPLLFRLRFAASLPRLLVLTAFGGLGYGLLVYLPSCSLSFPASRPSPRYRLWARIWGQPPCSG